MAILPVILGFWLGVAALGVACSVAAGTYLGLRLLLAEGPGIRVRLTRNWPFVTRPSPPDLT